MVYNVVSLVVVLTALQSGVLSARISSNNHEARDSKQLNTGLQPFFVSNSNTVYGGYSSKPIRLSNSKNKLLGSIGSPIFYSQDLYSYIQTGITLNTGIFGFAAHFDTTVSSDYTFFKSINNHNLQEKKISTSHDKRHPGIKPVEDEEKSNLIIRKRQDDRVQCRNQLGDSSLFSKSECLSAANKMTLEKTAMSICGACQLIMIGPQGQLSSSNMPASELQGHASSMLDGCVTGRRVDATNMNTKSTNPIPKNLKPTFVLLLTQGSGPNCN